MFVDLMGSIRNILGRSTDANHTPERILRGRIRVHIDRKEKRWGHLSIGDPKIHPCQR